MTSTSAPITDPTTAHLVKLIAVAAIFALSFCAWSMWSSSQATTKAGQDCILATGRHAAAGYPSTYTPPECR